MRKIAIFLAILIILLTTTIAPKRNLEKPLPTKLDKASIIIGECEYCEEKIYSDSSRVKVELASKDVDMRPIKLKRFLGDRNSPLADYAEYIVACADRHKVDWRLVPAISGIESAFAILNAAPYNAYGWAGGGMAFGSWEESIEVVTRALRENYINRGADTVAKIAPIYCPPNYIKWTGAVTRYMAQIDNTSTAAKLGSTELVELTL